jgi:hypothetical protein
MHIYLWTALRIMDLRMRDLIESALGIKILNEGRNRWVDAGFRCRRINYAEGFHGLHGIFEREWLLWNESQKLKNSLVSTIKTL